ncbi:MAG: hypothetical protein ACOC2Y_02600 [Spirochaetota bacterium]
MKLRYRFANQAVGGSAILAVVPTVTLIVLMRANRRWFRENCEYYARFETAKDVSVGMAITFGGGEILFHQGRDTTLPLPEGTEFPIYNSKQGLRPREENRVIVLRDADPTGQAPGRLDPISANVDRELLNVAGLTEEMEPTLQRSINGRREQPSTLRSRQGRDLDAAHDYLTCRFGLPRRSVSWAKHGTSPLEEAHA